MTERLTLLVTSRPEVDPVSTRRSARTPLATTGLLTRIRRARKEEGLREATRYLRSVVTNIGRSAEPEGGDPDLIASRKYDALTRGKSRE